MVQCNVKASCSQYWGSRSHHGQGTRSHMPQLRICMLQQLRPVQTNKYINIKKKKKETVTRVKKD